jgi:hypothetical protein
LPALDSLPFTAFAWLPFTLRQPSPFAALHALTTARLARLVCLRLNKGPISE